MINKTRRNFSLLAVAIIMALAFAACDKSRSQAAAPSSSPFEGTWRFAVPGLLSMDMIFTGNEWESVATAYGETQREKGTFTYTATHITASTTHEWDGSSWTATAESDSDEDPTAYTLSGNVLTLTLDGDEVAFVKQE